MPNPFSPGTCVSFVAEQSVEGFCLHSPSEETT
jgi:hypothetical protein